MQGGTENKGIRITSNDPISVYGLNYYFGSTAAFLALPVNALGTDYRVVTFTSLNDFHDSHFSVVATEDNTVLTIYNHWTNSTSNITLNQGQTFINVEAHVTNEDITGSRIQSSHPVAVFGSNTCVNIPDPTCMACDQVVEQMFPYYAWGKNYITVPLAGRDESGDIFRIVSSDDGNQITINGSLAATINAGDYYETNLSVASLITTSSPALLAQFAKGQMCSGNTIGDPLMMLIPPREQFLTAYTLCTIEGFEANWVNIVAPDYAVNSIYQDGLLIPNTAFTQVGTSSYFGARLPVSTGSHTFNSLHPFGLFVYGWNLANSYGYPGGGSLAPVGTVNSVTITPATATGELNVSTICFTAHVEDNYSNPVAGVLVNFNISGISNMTGNAYSDATGNALYCYARTGTTPGTDNVYAECFGFNSTTSTATWTYMPPCSNPANSGIIGYGQTGCGSFTPAPLMNVTLPSGQTGTLEYKWQQSTTGSMNGFSDIAGSNAPSFSPGSITQTTWYRRLARVDCMSDWTGAAITDALEMTVVTPIIPSVTITSDFTQVCAGETVHFTAIPVNGGTAPVYQWKVNGVNLGPDNLLFAYSPVNGDVVTCSLASSETCSSGNPALSNPLTMVVNANLQAGITIVASSNPFCQGSAVTFTATPGNGGTSPIYHWIVNGTGSGINSSIFAYNPVNNDSVRCVMTSSLNCVIPNPSSSGKIILISSPAPNITFTTCFDTVTTISSKPFKLKGGTPLGGIFSGQGVDQATGVFTPSAAGTGLKTILYSYTNVLACSASKTKTILVQPDAAFTCGTNLSDIRDNKIYRTVQIGTQCWMKENLDYGLEINAFTFQTDNCISEKYMHNSSFYQWDELMRYDPVAASQGLCPPGWHVPTSVEWDDLISAYSGPGLAGGFLADIQSPNGFQSHQLGILYLNNIWAFTTGLYAGSMYWTSTISGNERAVARGLNNFNLSVSKYEAARGNAFAVRCLRD